MGRKTWTELKIKTLTDLWNGDKHSASQIAVIIEAPSRNSVIGKARRLNLKSKGVVQPTAYGWMPSKGERGPRKPSNIRRVVARKRTRYIQTMTLPAAVGELPYNMKTTEYIGKNILGGMDIFEVGADQCRYIVEDGESIFDLRFCAKPIERGAYCHHHAALCYYYYGK